MNIETAHDRLIVMLRKLKELGVGHNRLMIMEQAVKELYGAAKISVKYRYGDRVVLTERQTIGWDDGCIEAGWHGTIISNEWNGFTNEMSAHVKLDLTEHDATYMIPYSRLDFLDKKKSTTA